MKAKQIVIAGCVTEDKRVLLVPTTSGWILPFERVDDHTNIFEVCDALADAVMRASHLVCRPQDLIDVRHPVDGCDAYVYLCDIGLADGLAPGCHLIRADQIGAAPIREEFLQPLMDVLSILPDPDIKPNEYPEDVLPVEGIFLTPDGRTFFQETLKGRYEHRRLRA